MYVKAYIPDSRAFYYVTGFLYTDHFAGIRGIITCQMMNLSFEIFRLYNFHKNREPRLSHRFRRNCQIHLHISHRDEIKSRESNVRSFLLQKQHSLCAQKTADADDISETASFLYPLIFFRRDSPALLTDGPDKPCGHFPFTIHKNNFRIRQVLHRRNLSGFPACT